MPPSVSKPLVARMILVATAVYWLILFGLTHSPAGHVPPMPISDKTEHLVSYGTLAALLMLVMWTRRPHPTANAAVIVLAIGMIYGAVDEWTQALPFIRRDCSLLDWYADIAGLAVGVVVM